MHDRAMQALYLLALDPVAETTADPNSYGFRPERSPADAIGQCFITLAREAAPQWILEGDITSCFDRINHDWMLNHIPTERTVLQKWLKAGYIEQYVRYPTDEGTPQGGVISPTLANVTLDGLEHLLRTSFPRTKDGRSPMVNLVRYADDFIITGRSRELLEHEVQPLVEAFLRARGLELSPEKTHVTHIKDGFDFLGQHIRKYQAGRRHKLLITPARKSVKTFLDAVRTTIRSNKQTPAAILIGLLNPRIVGWANYHRHVVSKETYSSVDNAIYQALWRWAKRRHPQKSRTWIAQHYFKRHGGDNWRFYGETTGKTLLLRNAAQLPITRHVKIKDGANPYDPAWEIYFEQRLGVKMGATLRGRRHLMHLWKEQGGCCPVCQEPITELTGWHNHHIIWRTHGGTDHAENRVLLHPTCHRKVHALGLYVEKPRPSSGV